MEIDETDLDDGSWNHCLVGHFLYGKMAFPLLSSTAKYVWGKKGLKIVRQLDSRFIFEFEDEDSKLRALENGPYFFSRRYLVLKKFHHMLVLEIEHPTSIPTWIKVHKLPLEFWTKEGFSRIGSAIGKPLRVDMDTEKRRRLDYARICVEVDAVFELPNDFKSLLMEPLLLWQLKINGFQQSVLNARGLAVLMVVAASPPPLNHQSLVCLASGR